MKVTLSINSIKKTYTINSADRLLDTLRADGYFSVKHGCDTGECGVCGVLLDGEIVNSCTLLTAQAEGHRIETVEGLGSRNNLHPLQEAFVDAGAVQCGFCTPAQILSAKSLLDKDPHPTEADIRDAIGGVLCRCTGYKNPVEAVKTVNSE